MNFLESYTTAIKSLSANKVRSALTMLGVIIGVFAVITLVSLGRGIQNYVSSQFESIGSNLLFIFPGKADLFGDPATAFTNNKLEEKHVKLIETYGKDYILAVTPSIRISKNAFYKSKSFYITINGTNHKVSDILNTDTVKGRFFTQSEENAKAKVAVIGWEVEKNLFGSRDSVGDEIKIDNKSFKVIGTMEQMGAEFDERVYVPYTTVESVFGIKTYSNLAAKAYSSDGVKRAAKELERILQRDLKEDEFSVLTQENILSSIQDILRILTLGVGAIAGISLLVGGIGIMNIMLVSVTERTKEIGLRKAVGATSFDIALQFVLESMMLSVSGGLLGLLLGWLVSLLGRSFIQTEVPWWSVLLAFVFSAVVGVVFGTYPAIKASKKDPIEALRYE